MSERIDIGNGHSIQPITWPGDEKPSGFSVFHPNPDTGAECGCSVWINPQRRAGTIWTVLSLEPLTLSPSVQCANCRDHGFIRDGYWIPA